MGSTFMIFFQPILTMPCTRNEKVLRKNTDRSHLNSEERTFLADKVERGQEKYLSSCALSLFETNSVEIFFQ